MPTPAERSALLFFAGLFVLGSAVRAHRAFRDHPKPDAASRLALRRQLAAVDSARAKSTTKPKPRREKKAKAPKPPRTRRPRKARDTASTPGQRAPIDLDLASAKEIERLPRIGPTLAARIVADRDSLGPFGSLSEFQRVRGVGPAMAKTVAPHVTFSLARRPSPVTEGVFAAPSTARATRHRSRPSHPP